MQYIFIRYGRDKKDALQETLKLSIITVIVFLLSFYIPIASLGIGLTPALFAFITYRNGMIYTLLSALMVGIAIMLVLTPLTGIYISAIFAGIGLALGEFTYRKKSAPLAIFAGAIVVILNVLLLMLIESQMVGADVLDYIMNVYKQQYELTVGVGSSADINSFLIMVRRMFPGIIISMGLIISTINYLILGKIIMKTTHQRKTAMLSEFSLPGNIFGGILIIYLLSWILMSGDYLYKETLALNLGIILGLLFFMQGLAAIYYFLHTRTKPLLRNIIMVCLCLAVPFYTFVVMIGFADALFNLRKIKR